jgi:hypothetical protein
MNEPVAEGAVYKGTRSLTRLSSEADSRYRSQHTPSKNTLLNKEKAHLSGADLSSGDFDSQDGISESHKVRTLLLLQFHLLAPNQSKNTKNAPSRMRSPIRLAKKPKLTQDSLRNTETLCHIPLVAAHPQFLTILQDDEVMTVEPGLDLADAADVDDGGAMDANELAGIQPGFQSCQALPDLIITIADVKLCIIARGGNPVDIFYVDQYDAAIGRDCQTIICLSLLQTGEEHAQAVEVRLAG